MTDLRQTADPEICAQWDWCPYCKNGLDTGLQCDQCLADLMPVQEALRELQRLRSSGGACDSPLAAGDAFVAAFKREPKDPADLAWMNGYAAGRRAPEPREQQWQPIETAPKGRTLLLGYWNDLGNWRTVMGCYYAEETLESETEDSGFAPPGWYESTQAYEYLAPLDKEPTHWQPLPKGLPKRSQETKEVKP